MLDILAITGPIYLAIAIGFASTRAGWFTRTDMRVLGQFVVKLALPALVFSALASRPLREILNPGYLLAYLAGSLAMLVVGWQWCRRVAGLDATSATIQAMGMSCSNSGFVGYPILLLVMAPVAGVALALNMIVENVVMIPLLLTLAERSRGSASPTSRIFGRAVLRLGANPLIIGLMAGLAVSWVGWRLPPWTLRTVTMFAQASGALSLFVIGGTLVGLPLRGLGPRVLPITLAKLIVHPTLVLLAVLALPWLGLPPLDPALRAAAVLLAAMPMMSIYAILAQAYGHESLASAALLVTTGVSFFTLSALIGLLQVHV